MSTGNTIQVNINQAKNIISAVMTDAFVNKGVHPDPICMHGSPGLGKSAIVKEVARELEEATGKQVEVIDIRLSAMEAADVQGIPYVSETGLVATRFVDGEEIQYPVKDMFFSTPSWWPSDSNKIFILFLDEIKNAPPAVQHAAYRLILDRSCQNGETFGENVAVLAAGNLKSDKTGARELLPAAANRFGVHLYIDSKKAAEAFVDYAVQTGFHSAIWGFLQWKSAHVYTPPNDVEAGFPTPRAWEFVNKHLHNEILQQSPALLRTAIAGAIGTEAATAFMGYLDHYKDLPNWPDVRKGKTNYTIPDGGDSLKYAVGTTLAAELMDALREHGTKDDGGKVKDLSGEVDNLVKVFEQLPKEMTVVVFKTMQRDVKVLPRINKHPNLKAIAQQVTSKIRKKKA